MSLEQPEVWGWKSVGKIRVKTLGDETKEQQEKAQAQKRAEAKRAEKIEANTMTPHTASIEDSSPNEPVKNSSVKRVTSTKKPRHSTSYQEAVALIDKKKEYALSEALQILPTLKRAKFDETVELHLNTADI